MNAFPRNILAYNIILARNSRALSVRRENPSVTLNINICNSTQKIESDSISCSECFVLMNLRSSVTMLNRLYLQKEFVSFFYPGATSS
jgi:hypothetical protein